MERKGIILAGGSGTRLYPVEIAYSAGMITRDQFLSLAKQLEKSSYGQYLLKLMDE